MKSAIAKSLILASVVFTGGCILEDEETKEEIPHPVLENDDSIVIDPSSGDYTCYNMETTFGSIKLAIDNYYAPATAENFNTYVTAGFYDGLVFHRVISDFMIQGGGINEQGEQQETMDPVIIESRNGLKNYRGRIAMARTHIPDSATSQFFINVVDNEMLNYKKYSNDYVEWGYTVFGGVIEGMDVVDEIRRVDTDSNDKPLENVVINSVTEMSCPTS